MMLNRNSVALGLMVGVFAGAAGGALATSGATPKTTTIPRAAVFGPGHLGMHGGWLGQVSVLDAAVGYLGLTKTELQTQLQAGKTLAQIAQAQGKSVSGLEDAILAAAKSKLDANSALTADQKAARLAQLKIRLATIVNGTKTCLHLQGAGTTGTHGMGMGMHGMGTGSGMGMGMGAMWR
jgi:hypothetical protein